ncbi:MAG: hypothetical protein A2998_01630 [Candidatus Staskawiczbacteria bacterium RIFCSPLOWO2_01_FULL_37_25b]|uniref:Chorismate mutase domain-containing protein n=2 Tax=Candidatus Staskawicziibacteriota TaxID=1817916 RepID=A0A1G2HMM2_9BACT|nr:MAG: hypothetical protein A2812_02745 [Candidatus Staskawiczbacteria bacterium RIFCSPHIGHO2_01_FULL_36_16]OGZ74249.1 MAG: hypothetical protein A2998_01630 [Candidatus Staskawiczbacteria bacterium RIFCSPLOWO2_01_FULL_37_25b]
MTDKRKLEIAMASLKYVMRRQGGVHLTSQTKRELGNAAKETGIPAEELLEFFRPLVQEMVDEVFKK